MAPDVAPQPSFLLWLFHSLGITFSVLFLLSALGCFFLTLLLCLRGKGPMANACLLLVVHWPTMVGLLGAVTGIISMFQVLARSSATPKPSELAEGWAVALVTVLIGVLMTMFFYLLAIVGTLFRSFASESNAKT